MPFLILILLALAVAAMVGPLVRARAARRRRLATLARQQGWTYNAADPWNLVGHLSGTWLGSWGHDRRCRQVLTVQAERGLLWLAEFSRQMASGRRRRDERYAVVIARVGGSHGGVAVLGEQEPFAPAGPFHRYVRLDVRAAPRRMVWAERPTSERGRIARLALLPGQMPPFAAIEARGATAVAYWPVTRPCDVEDFVELEAAGRALLEALGAPDDRGQAPAPEER